MKFFAVAALATLAAAQYGTPAEESCSVVTVTVTSTLKHVPSAPASHGPNGPAPYPMTSVVKPTVPVGTGAPTPVKTPLGGTGAPKPSGTGAYSAPPTQFTGAASSFKVGGIAAAGAVAAFFL